MKHNYKKVLIGIFSIGIISTNLLAGDIDFQKQRDRLVRDHIIREGIKDAAVIRSLRAVPREDFVRNQDRKHAYANRPLPIGYGQTISQPYIVALMTELLSVEEGDVVLEIGTGSGYQAAVLAEIVKNVYTIEIIKPLASQAEKRFLQLGYSNIKVKYGDGYFGWEEYAPFDAIVVTAAAQTIPPPLLKQLKKGGKMCIPVGAPFLVQDLKLVEKNEKGELRTYDIIPVRFVPFTRELRE
jgi:protein-L-isoaspartate(D-aspartate) O-methyltransferase